jgi:8-hydroxy-5-deazaflavin:NADPH oxidoreductase
MNNRIGIMGTGEVGRALGTGMVAAGYEVRVGSREAANAKAIEWAGKHGSRASSGTFADAPCCGKASESGASIARASRADC